MSIEITLVVLLAAAFHAGWNTIIKISGDRVAVMAFVTLAGSLISLLFLPFVEAPNSESWPFLGLTIILHTGYHFFLPVLIITATLVKCIQFHAVRLRF